MTYNSTLPKVFVYLLTTIETLYQTRVPLEVQNRKNVHLATSDCLVIACYLWGVLHFSETLKAKHQLAQSLFPNFLEYSRFVRRCNALLPSIQVIRQALVFKEVEGMSVSIIDSFPFLCVSLFVTSEAKFLEIMPMLATMLQRDSTSMDVNVML
ncbi:hypothetical protein ML8HA_01616 [Lactococcus lactis]|nr:hypothetical protein [Lactococcus lactis]